MAEDDFKDTVRIDTDRLMNEMILFIRQKAPKLYGAERGRAAATIFGMALEQKAREYGFFAARGGEA